MMYWKVGRQKKKIKQSERQIGRGTNGWSDG